MKKLSYRSLLICVGISMLLFSCSKSYLDTQPTDQISEDDAFSTVANAQTALNGIYRALYMQYASQSEDGLAAMMITMDFMGEDIVHSASGTSYFRNDYKWVNHRSVSSALNYFAYRFFYKIIANANMILANIDGIEGDEGVKKTIKGEAMAIRGWAHSYLVQLFGSRYDAAAVPNNQWGVPVVTKVTIDPLPRNTVEEVYTQVVKDLDSAMVLLTNPSSATNNTHLKLASVQGIRARVALTMQSYDTAAKYASLAKQSYSLMSNTQYLEGFNSLSNPEWMWGANQLANQLPSYGSFFAYMSANFNSAHTRPNPKKINTKLYTALASTDIRKKLWWDGTTADEVNFPGVINASTGQPEPTQVKRAYQHRKYKVKDPSVSVGDIPFMRAAEMHLIEAEALARAGKYTDAATALYTLAVNRNPSYVKSTKTGTALIDEIMIQRRAELWGEGFRFLDLKRTNSPLDRSGTGATSTLATVAVTTPIPAGDVRWQFLIPQDEMNVNPYMIQNP
ncbi:MAG: RagB/SusD family nutrient uptake outer membrane protein [Chitinophagaceae bacterium]